MLPTPLAWIENQGAKLDAVTRARLLALFRPPGWLPSWLHGLWYTMVARVARLSLILAVEGDRCDLAQCHCKVGCTLPALGLVVGRAPAGALQSLCTCADVTRIWLDHDVHTPPDETDPGTWDVPELAGFKGRGVTIAVVGTGIYPHPDLGGRVIAFADFVGCRTSPYDDHGHGTRLAGLAAGAGEELTGLAPGALLLGVKVLGRGGWGTVSALLRGIDWVVRHRERYGVRVMAVGPDGPGEPLSLAIQRAREAGITVARDGAEAGLAALLLEAGPGLTPAQVRARLRSIEQE